MTHTYRIKHTYGLLSDRLLPKAALVMMEYTLSITGLHCTTHNITVLILSINDKLDKNCSKVTSSIYRDSRLQLLSKYELWFRRCFRTAVSEITPVDTNAHSQLMTFCPRQLRWATTRRINHSGFSEAETIGWQWHQLDHMQVICPSHQTDNHASTSSVNTDRTFVRTKSFVRWKSNWVLSV